MTEPDGQLAELRQIAADRARLDLRRDELVRALMLSEVKVSRKEIADAAELSVPRLYQIRNGL